MLLALLLPAAARADEAALLERIEQLELRMRDLEAERARNAPATASGGWADRVRIGGSANVGYWAGDDLYVDDSFQVWDARFFVDADLGREVQIADHTVFRNIAFTFEWDLVRVGNLQNDVGELYVDFQGVFGQDYLNLQVGRFQIPVGEAYLRYSQGYATRPFISHPVGGPWWWDEGVRLYGSWDRGRYGYVASVSNGDTAFNYNYGSGHQATLRLFWRPTDWLYLSVSGLRSGEVGSDETAASAALWLGEGWARAFGSGTSIPSFYHGMMVAPGPNELDGTWLVGGDAIVDLEDKLNAWLAYGYHEIDSHGYDIYDRALHYWIAEVVLRGAWAAELLRPFYLGARASGVGTFDDDEGYALDRRLRSTLGYDMKSLIAYSVVLGWELNPNVRMRAEYTRLDIDLVRGATAGIRDDAGDFDLFAFEVGVSF